MPSLGVFNAHGFALSTGFPAARGTRKTGLHNPAAAGISEKKATRETHMGHAQQYSREDLLEQVPRFDTFVGIDSDGCVFDTMEIKQKVCFHTLIIEQWNLQPIEPLVREVAEFVNLYSTKRGRNRFLSLVDTMDMLRRRPEVQASGLEIPMLNEIRTLIASGAALGNPALQEAVDRTGNPELADVLAWSLAVNRKVAEVVKNLPPFPSAKKSLEKIHAHSDAIVVSQTPTEALVREWEENGLSGYISIIAGQELGTKAEHLELATKGKYQPRNVLMIGDAPGDLSAARANQALFYPINPAHEEESWARFFAEAYDRFLANSYEGPYQDECIREFEALLPETPPWKS
jgi:phosphoglycolate phosphatase-like HAD superfamily hydrolase